MRGDKRCGRGGCVKMTCVQGAGAATVRLAPRRARGEGVYPVCVAPDGPAGDRSEREQAMRVLVTGGAGYIGSHTCLELLQAEHEVLVVDNLSNSSEESLRRVGELAGRAPALYREDLRDREALD